MSGNAWVLFETRGTLGFFPSFNSVSRIDRAVFLAQCTNGERRLEENLIARYYDVIKAPGPFWRPPGS
jgi:hypothetical protein